MARIERRFLLEYLPAEVQGGTHILQGYVAHDAHREVRIGRHGCRQFLSVREGFGQPRRETEVEISAEQFQALWSSVEGRRLEKIRAEVAHGGLRVAVYRYLGDLAPLLVAEVSFSSKAERDQFEKPAYLGEEITEADEYQNVSLAMHGLPHGPASNYQVGALPFLFRGGRLHLVLVSNGSQTRWIIPKGQPEPDMSRQDVAIMEAIEEAGVIGNCLPGLRSSCHRQGSRTLHIYPLKVTTVLKKWPEMEWRKRAVLPLNKALKTISDPELVRCIRYMASHLVT